MEYSFDVEIIKDLGNRKVPYINLINHKDYGEFLVDEIRNLSQDYLKEIVSQLEKVINGQIEGYDFGYEVYNLECDKNQCKVLNTFEDWKVESIIPTKDIYQLLKEWKGFIEKHT